MPVLKKLLKILLLILIWIELDVYHKENMRLMRKLYLSFLRETNLIKMSEYSTHIPTKNLSNGLEMPILGLGTYKEQDAQKLNVAIKAAIKTGIRHIDCAYCYYNEQHIGQALIEAIQESNGQLKREDFFIVSKLWNTFRSRERVQKALNESLSRLGLDYLDLFLIHWPMDFLEGDNDDPADEKGNMIPAGIHFTETYKFMEELIDQGKVKSIGISNFNIEQTKEILNMCRIKPVCNQFEIHPYLQNRELVDFCLKENIAVVAYAPLGAPDRSWSKPGEPVVLKNPLLLDLTKKYNKTPAQIILRWLIQRDIIPIPKSVTPSRIEENTKVFDFVLSNEDMDLFKNNFTQNFRYYVYDECFEHPFYPFDKPNKLN